MARKISAIKDGGALNETVPLRFCRGSGTSVDYRDPGPQTVPRGLNF